MNVGLIIAIACAGALLGIAAGYWLPPHGRVPARNQPSGTQPNRLPFTGEAVSRRSFEAAVRLAKAEDAIIMPAFLAQVPMNLPLETPLPVERSRGMPLLEAIEQRASSQGVPVDFLSGAGAPRATRWQTDRARALRSDIVSADEDPRVGLSYEDLRWMLDRVPAEIMILRPAPKIPAGSQRRGGQGALLSNWLSRPAWWRAIQLVPAVSLAPCKRIEAKPQARRC